ncbi:hypothetical protein PANDA_008792 [Ailuropoda melanoleuca]|uniref:Uncharacterized protein n=1 Tax=Ailuropoda melanoleuca TaxID=9646 RepID=D2HDL4_AILME|nr:hypothetical protein PANDA_008792 [Ailuropoda melanoleuca]
MIQLVVHAGNLVAIRPYPSSSLPTRHLFHVTDNTLVDKADKLSAPIELMFQFKRQINSCKVSDLEDLQGFTIRSKYPQRRTPAVAFQKSVPPHLVSAAAGRVLRYIPLWKREHRGQRTSARRQKEERAERTKEEVPGIRIPRAEQRSRRDTPQTEPEAGDLVHRAQVHGPLEFATDGPVGLLPADTCVVCREDLLSDVGFAQNGSHHKLGRPARHLVSVRRLCCVTLMIVGEHLLAFTRLEGRPRGMKWPHSVYIFITALPTYLLTSGENLQGSSTQRTFIEPFMGEARDPTNGHKRTSTIICLCLASRVHRTDEWSPSADLELLLRTDALNKPS